MAPSDVDVAFEGVEMAPSDVDVAFEAHQMGDSSELQLETLLEVEDEAEESTSPVPEAAAPASPGLELRQMQETLKNIFGFYSKPGHATQQRLLSAAMFNKMLL